MSARRSRFRDHSKTDLTDSPSVRVLGEGSKSLKRQMRLELNAVFNLQSMVMNERLWDTSPARSDALHDLEKAIAKVHCLQETARSVIPCRNSLCFDDFRDWLSSHGMDMAKVPFHFASLQSEYVDNWTVFATEDIQEGGHIMTVPSTMMMTIDTALESGISRIVEALPALKAVPSIVLALHLLAEAADNRSRFRPYIRTLPGRFSIPFSLPFSASQYAALKPSQAFDRAVKVFKSQVLQYTKIYELLIKQPKLCDQLGPEIFTYANFEWAVSVVMTRQNAVPSMKSSGSPSLALVPVWDMCNHENGPHTTAVIVNKTTSAVEVECKAMRSFKKGEALTIFYGERSNVELLLFSGFILDHNDFDSVNITVCLDGADKRETITNIVTIRKNFGNDVDIFKDFKGGSVLQIAAGADGLIDSVIGRAAYKESRRTSDTDVESWHQLTQQIDDKVKELCRRLLSSAILSRLQESNDAADAMGGCSNGIADQLILKLHRREAEILRCALARMES